MMEIIEVEEKEFYLVYEDDDAWYEFPCDAAGHVLLNKCPYPDTTEKSLAYCKARQDWAKKNGEVVTVVTHNRYGICPCCGHRICLGGNGFAPYMGLVKCDCGQWYNVFGQMMRPPEDWYDRDDDWYDRDDVWYDELYNDWKDESYKYWYEGWIED